MRRVLPFLVLLVVCAASLGAQEMEDVVYLKDGTVVRGQIIEQIPNQSIRIRTSDGSVYVYTFNLIERITREPVQVAAPEPAAGAAVQEEARLKHERKGFFFGLGFGYGSLGLDDVDDREGGLSGNLKLGAALNQNLLIGVQSNGWTKNFEEVDGTITFGVVSGIVQFYPSANGGLYVAGGAGLGVLSASAFGESDSESGFGYVFGVGYDLRLGSSFSLTPYFYYFGASINEQGINALQTGLAINFH
jgi:hypothetical protein